MKPKQKKHRKIAHRYLFLGAVVLSYLAVYPFHSDLVVEALLGFWLMLKKVIPILAVVFVLLVLFNRFVNAAMVRKQLGDGSGLRGWFFAVIGGILMMGPPYVLYPMLAEMRQMGARYGLIAVFLYNRNVKIPFLPVMVLCFGLQYSIFLSVFIIIFSIINGLLIEWFMKDYR